MSRTVKDFILQSLTYIASSIGVLILVLIIGFVFIKGYQSLSWEFIVTKYKPDPYWVKVEKDVNTTFDKPADLDESIIWSEKWGIGLTETINRDKKEVIEIEYIHKDSPLRKEVYRYNSSDEDDVSEKKVLITQGFTVSRYKLDYPLPAKSAQDVIQVIDDNESLFLEVTQTAGGIRGSILTTFIMIITTLIIALPFGISIALYLTEYAKKNRIILVMRSMIDMLAGVPSIVFGIFGMLLFFRYFRLSGNTGGGGYTILGGALTLVAILLPVIIRATEEALKAVPQELRHASLALGANRAQTIFKVVIPSAIPGILTATILSIGRIIGESAALILVAGTMVNDTPVLFQGGATLAVQIWDEMSGEQPNIEVAAAISILIIIIVLILNILVKLMSKYLNKANY